MKILFPHLPPSTTSQVLADLVMRFTPRKSRSTNAQETSINFAKVIRIKDSEGTSEYFGLVEPTSEDDARCFLAIANELSRHNDFVVARELKKRGPRNPFFSAKDDWRRSDLKFELVTDLDPKDTAIH